jgi:hypothetical protein
MDEREGTVPAVAEVLRLIGNAASGALETRGYDRATLEFIHHLVWTVLPVECRQPVRVHRADVRDVLATLSPSPAYGGGRPDGTVPAAPIPRGTNWTSAWQEPARGATRIRGGRRAGTDRAS